jgi:hypothetical protein
MPRTATLLLAGIAFTVLLACASSETKTTWVAPDAAEEMKFRKVLAIGVAPDEHERYIIEDELHTQVTRVEVVESYSLMPLEQLRDTEKLRARCEREGFDGVLVFRVVGVEEESSYVSAPMPMYGGLWDYYPTVWPTYWDTGYVRTEQSLVIETRIFAVRDGRQLWTARSNIVEPQALRSAVIQVVDQARRELQRQNLIP